MCGSEAEIAAEEPPKLLSAMRVTLLIALRNALLIELLSTLAIITGIG